MSEEAMRLLDGGLSLGLAIAGLVIVTRLVVSIQFKLVQTTFDRNVTLEERLEKVERRNEELEGKLDAEQDGHRLCRQELNEHKIDSAAKMAKLEAQVEMLTDQMNRSRRVTDPPAEGETR